MGLSREARKWMALVGEVLMMFTFGTTYCFGNLNPYFTSYMRHALNDTSITYATTTWVNSFVGIGQAGAMPLAGLLERHFGVRLAALFGCAIFSGGVFLSAFTMNWSFYAFAASYGLMFGVGTGLVYPLCIACSIRWFPDKKGLITGVTLLGYGLSSFIFNIVQTAIINPHNLSPDSFDPNDKSKQKFFTQPEVLDRVPFCFFVLAASYGAMQLIGVVLINSPNPGDVPASDRQALVADPELNNDSEAESHRNNESTNDNDNSSINGPDSQSQINHDPDSDSPSDVKPRDVLRSKHFYMLYFIFSCNNFTANFINTQYKAFGQSFISDDFYLTLVGSLASVFNAAGRIFWGFVADRTSNKFALFTICCLGGALFFSIYTSSVLPYQCYAIWVCLIFLSFSGQFAVCPATIAKMFGTKHFATNYGLLFTTGIIASLLTSTIVTLLLQLIGYFGMFCICGGLYVAAAIVAFLFRAKTYQGVEV